MLAVAAKTASNSYLPSEWPVACALLLVLCAAPQAAAVCKESLLSADLQQLDATVDADPLKAIERARQLLALAPNNAQRGAELYAIIADANNTLADNKPALEAVTAARERLELLPSSVLRARIALRLALVEADTAEGEQALLAAVARLNDWQTQLERGSLGEACLQLVRSRVNGRLAQHELAAEDGLMAHALAKQLRAGDAQSEAAYQLATTFRRAGLTEQALAFADEAIAYTRRQRQPAALSIALFTKAQVLGEAGRHTESLQLVSQSRVLSVELHDELGRAFSDHEICVLQVALGHLDEAKRSCQAAVDTFRKGGRIDQALLSEEKLARIELARGHVAQAQRLVDRAFAEGLQSIPPALLPRLYRTRSEVRRLTRQYASAVDDLRRSVELTERLDERRRGLAAAVLHAQMKFADSQRERDSLSRQLTLERQQAAVATRSRQLTLGLAIVGGLCAVLLAYLLWLSRRHARVLRRQQLTLRTLAENSPDILLLLDGTGAIRFASRGLEDGAGSISSGMRLADYFPATLGARVQEILQQLIEERRPVEMDVRVPNDFGERQYELRASPVLEQGRLLGATMSLSDVTELRATERKVLDVVSRERRRISSDLHEGLGQELTGIALQLRAVATAIAAGDAPNTAQIDDLVQQVDRTIVATRNLARGFSPMRTDTGSLSASLASLAAEASRRLRIAVTSRSVPADITVSDEVGEHLYCIAFEAVTNAARHGQVQRVTLELREDSGQVVLTATDDGRGIAPPSSDNEGWGLRMMRYRARLLGAALHIGPSPSGSGTQVRVDVSLADERAA